MFDGLGKRLERARKLVDIARSGAKVFRNVGLKNSLTPSVALQLARELPKRRKGALAVIHLHALADPLRPAIVCGETRLSYGEFEARIHRLTHALRTLGISSGERIGAFLHNSHEHLELNAALAAVGGVSVQIGYRLKGAEVAYLLENSGARAMIFHADLAATVEEALREARPSEGAKLTKQNCIAVGGAPGYRSYDSLLESGDPSEPAMAEAGGFGGMMVYTSGTTGKSKGATRDFRKMGIEPVLDFMSQIPIRRDERHLVVCPLYHSLGQAFVFMTQSVGGCNVILPHFEPEAALRAIERERISSTAMVPTMLQRILALPTETLRKYDTSSLRWIMSGAAPLPTETARRVEDTFGPILYNFYGATETGFVTLAKPGEHTARPGTIGKAVRGANVRILDGEGRDVPEGQVGELYVKSTMLMDGYHRNDEATRAGTRDGYFSVGDLAWRDAEGYLYLADRKTDMVISGGVNIYPWEIEQRLHEHPAVHEAAVIGVPDAEWGESLVAYVVLNAGRECSGDELAEFVRQKLADFKRPRRFHFVESLPRTPTGKILKRELKQRAAQA
jgi:fatty-acyl-CoA synthase